MRLSECETKSLYAWKGPLLWMGTLSWDLGSGELGLC